eukprot:COSAG01_NODE_9546_length_2413_cov_18.550130_1_plen_88_part_00
MWPGLFVRVQKVLPKTRSYVYVVSGNQDIGTALQEQGDKISGVTAKVDRNAEKQTNVMGKQSIVAQLILSSPADLILASGKLRRIIA